MNNIYSGMTIANAILEHFKNEKRFISNLFLQKILYYVNVDYLLETKRALIFEPFEKWVFGPILFEVYRNYRDFGRSNIPSPCPDSMQEIFKPEIWQKDNQYFENKVEKKDLNRILKLSDKIYDKYYLDPFQLVTKTTNETIWKKDSNRILASEHINYTDKEIYDFFTNACNGDLYKWLNLD